MKDIKESLVICDAVRTPFSYGTALKEVGPDRLLELVLRALVERNRLKGEDVSAVVTGSVLQDSRYSNLARIGSMKAGLPESLRDFSVQANCNSGFVGLLNAVGGLLAGLGSLYLATGVESMSGYGYRLEDKSGLAGSVDEIEEALKERPEAFLENFAFISSLNECLTDTESGVSMIEVAEVMANRFGISREEQDSYTLERLEAAVKAVESGVLAGYIIEAGGLKEDNYPLNRKRMLKRPAQIARAATVFSDDSPYFRPADFYQRHRADLERLGIEEIVPSVTMYNSSIPGDGAGGCILTTEERARELGLEPKLRLISWATAGVNPLIMGIGPMESTCRLFEKPMTARAAGVGMDKLDLIELHEAFACQVLAVFKESEKSCSIGWPREIINPYGGSLAFTHPLGATNFRLLANIMSYFEQNESARYALAAGCAGGGLGLSLLFERFS